ncbi:MAG TPA: hypothetical protein VEC19_18650 [Usitatibacter sp.]|nr:hypothetical protein [Usitatibacter sp.]
MTSFSRAFTACLAAALVIALSPAWAQDTRITITHNGYTTGGIAVPAGVFLHCRSAPTCTSEEVVSISVPGCPGTYAVNVRTTVTGLHLAQSSLQGTIVTGVVFPGGCTEIFQVDLNYTYTGSWNPSTREGSITIVGPTCNGCEGLTATIPATIKAETVPPPVFPMTVTANITPVSATASAQIQFRPQDVGSSGSVYVFAVAPAGRVLGGRDPGVITVGTALLEKAGQKADSCVISQVNAAGQLVAVTGAQLQAYLSGTLSSQGAAVSILNGTPTPNVSGATFYVGYGSSSSRMLDTGVFRNAVLVPGNDVCPMLPSQTSLWWNPNESGWGLNLNQQGSTLFGTLFTYDASRAPRWFVMSGGRMGADGITYTGDLYRTTGPAFNANPFTPIGAGNVTRVGTMTLSFGDASVGTLTYTVDGVQVRKTVQRQVFGSRAANCLPTPDSRVASTNYQDLWWNPAESGWGLNVTHQDNTVFATLFTYDSGGRDVWLVMSAGARQSDGSYLGELYRTSGPSFNSTPFTGVTATPVGTMRLRFSDGNTGTLTYTFNGATVTKTIQRQVFSSPPSTCN